MDGNTSYDGRIELCLDGEWGTICGNFWTDLDAIVVCRQLMLGISDATTVPRGTYPPGNGSIFLDQFFCSGREERITDCIHTRAESTCSHSLDAGVVCSGVYVHVCVCVCVYELHCNLTGENVCDIM